MLKSYSAIPDKEEQHGTETVVWKDQEQLKRFYERYRSEFHSLDEDLLKIVKMGSKNRWYDDAMFGRAILYSNWSQASDDKGMIKKAIDVVNDYLSLPSEYHLEEQTKAALQETFWNDIKEFVDPNQTYEENVRMTFRLSMAMQLLRLEEYEIAIAQYELTARNHPASKIAQEATKIQIELVKEMMAEKAGTPGIPKETGKKKGT